jgi:hypothetical protein
VCGKLSLKHQIDVSKLLPAGLDCCLIGVKSRLESGFTGDAKEWALLALEVTSGADGEMLAKTQSEVSLERLQELTVKAGLSAISFHRCMSRKPKDDALGVGHLLKLVLEKLYPANPLRPRFRYGLLENAIHDSFGPEPDTF